MVDSLQFLEADTLDCSAALYWRIIAQGKEAIPYLIDKLTDTTPLKIKFHCKKNLLNVAEVAQFALTEIAQFPAFLITKIRFDVITIDDTGEGCWSFYDFFFMNANKERYQRDMRGWYEKEKTNYTVKKIPRDRQTMCHKRYGIDSYFKWK